MKKKRIPIPDDISAGVLFASDRTCCVCRERGKAVQIHHIDDDPSNNDFGNLSVLCLECHNDTQIQGGFGRKLNSDLVTKYRDEWLERVKVRRDEADKLAISKVIGTSLDDVVPKFTEEIPYSEERSGKILEYVNTLPDLRREIEGKAQPEWDSGITARMMQASYDYIDALEGILVALAKFYPRGSFGSNPHRFFSEQIALRFKWHRSYAEPDGTGTGGTIINVTVGGSVMEDVAKMIEDMALVLVGYDDKFDWRAWPDKWNGKQG